MTDPSDVDWQLERLLATRRVVMEQPDPPNRETILQAIDDVIVRVE